MAERPGRRRPAEPWAESGGSLAPSGERGLNKEQPCRPEDGRAGGNSHHKETAAMVRRTVAVLIPVLIRRKETPIPY